MAEKTIPQTNAHISGNSMSGNNLQTQIGGVKSTFRKLAKLGGIALVALIVISSTIFTIDQTELGNVRRFGTVLYPADKPLRPGLHFKLPFVDTVDRIPVTLRTLHIPAFDVLTVDNQKVAIEENFNYTVPFSSTYHLMYEVGKSGNADIDDQVFAVVKDRTARVLAKQNMVSVNAQREAIQAEIEKNVAKAVDELFKIETHSLQIAAIRPSESFMHSIDAATKAKNEAIKAENDLRTKQFEAQQAAAIAKGKADAAIEEARGNAESIRLNAEAEKEKLVLLGEGQQKSLAAQIQPFGDADKYIEYVKTQAALKWNGQQPQIMTGSGGATTLVVPMPSMGNYNPPAKLEPAPR
jgi:regulator of protease activity HflC (stomatin/prohibitin superfamily)